MKSLLDYKWNESLVERMKEGDESAFEQCYLSVSAPIYTVIFNICRQQETAQELLHDTFIDIFENIQFYQTGKSFIAWAKRIAFNNTLNFIKKNNRLVLMESNPEDGFEVQCDALNQIIDSQWMETLLVKLSESERLVLWLFIVEQYNHEEIAILVDKTPSYSKSIISRALKRLRLSKEITDHAY